MNVMPMAVVDPGALVHAAQGYFGLQECKFVMGTHEDRDAIMLMLSH